MALPRNYSPTLFGTSGVSGSSAAGSRPAGYGVVHVVSALDLPCECVALPGEPCTGPGSVVQGKRGPIAILHPSRIQAALQQRDAGQLAVTVVELQRTCNKCSIVNGRRTGCPEHKCQRQDCPQSVSPGSSFCPDHHSGRQKMTAAKIEQLHRLRTEGMTHGQIADQLGVSKQTVFNYLQAAKKAADSGNR